MGLFGKRIDIKNATKVTYSEDDLKKLDMNYQKEFTVQRDCCIYTPFRKEIPRAWLTQMRDKAFEKILDDRLFTFKHLLVVPNPYGVSVQTALLLFNTTEECKVRYRIFGKVEGTDFCGETEITKRHRVPIIGLYKGYTNKLKLELVNADGEVIKRRDLTIYARDIPLNVQNIVTKVEHKDLSRFPFVMVNGICFNPIALDQNGEVRYSLQLKTNRLGMIPLQDGHFLYADISASRAGGDGLPASCQYHEMDYIGRIYRTYLLEYPIEKVLAQEGDSLFLLTASDKKYQGDCIVEVDRNSGEIKKRCDLSEVLGDRYKDRKMWAPVTAMSAQNGKLLITIKRFHSVLMLKWDDFSVQWLLAPKSIWKDTSLEDKCLSGVDNQNVKDYMPEHAVYEKGEDGISNLRMYCIQNKGTVPAEGAEASLDSRIVFYEIDEEKRQFRKIHNVDVVKCKRFGSSLYDPDSKRVLSLAGVLNVQGVNLRACIEEIDSTTEEVINRLRLYKRYCQAWLFEPDIVACSKALEKNLDVIHGQLNPPEIFEGQLPEPSEEKLKKRIFGNIRLCGNLFLFAFRPGTVQKVYLIGENYSYVQDYSGLKRKRKKISFTIPVNQLQYDEYQVYVEYDGEIYQLKNEIRVESKQTESKKKTINGGKR